MTAAPAWLRDKPFAHRGLHDARAGVPENSLAAFRAAVAAGFGIELDVRLSRDRVPMVFHDVDLKRLCGRAGPVRELDAAVLRSLSILGSQEKVPTLGEALTAIGGRVPVLIEIKHWGLERVAPIARLVAEAVGDYTGPFTIQSFNPRILGWFRRHAPAIVRGQIIDLQLPEGAFAWPRYLMTYLLLHMRHGAPHYVAYDYQRLPAPLAARARHEGLPVIAWTIRTPEQRVRALQLTDNIIFEAAGRPA